jgi:calcium/proton exchanger cax
MSEFLVGAVEAARATLGLSEVFVGVIVIAVIGNAAEHSTAVAMAMKNKMGLSLGIAIGSRAAPRGTTEGRSFRDLLTSFEIPASGAAS